MRCSECDLPLAGTATDEDTEVCLGPQACPACGSDCHDDQTIQDHGRCYDCHRRWQFGDLDEEDR